MIITVTTISIIDQTDNYYITIILHCTVECHPIHGDNPPPHPAVNSQTAARRQSIQRGMHDEQEEFNAA